VEKLGQGQGSSILIVEDSPSDYESIARAFKKLGIKNVVYHCESGEQALDFLYRRKNYSDAKNSPRPSVILLDLNLPGTSGSDVLKEIKNDPALKSIPIVVLTTSGSEKDIRECYQSGANSYMIKPSNWGDFFKMMESFKSYCLESASLPDYGI
jgi:CheY-like chemotaxis protein